MDTPTQTTELEAVNVMLALMGENPVNTLTAPFTADVANARRALTRASKEVQAESWKFNEAKKYTLSVNEAGEIPVASNVISVDADTDTSVDVVFRDGKLYDLLTNSFQFSADVVCELTFMFAFDELPETVRQYVMIKAGRRLQTNFVGSGEQEQFTKEDEMRARVVMCRDQASSADINILNDPNLAYITRRNSPRRFNF